MKGINLIVAAVVIWALLYWTTETPNPVESFLNLLNEVKDLTTATRLTHATENDNGDVERTADDLANEASETLGSPVYPIEYAMARMLRNERTRAAKGGNEAEAAAIVWVCINDAAVNNGGDIMQALTNGHGLGRQDKRKYASGREDPYDVDLELVRKCINGQVSDPTGGATHFMHRNGFESTADYQAAVNKWAARGWSRVDLDVGTSLEVWT